MTPYNPNDPLQKRFLDALSMGESSHRLDAEWLGVGGANLAGFPRRPDGFPVWNGYGHPVSHAAGVFQFEPATWAQLALQHQLNFSRLSDQYAGAWYLAQQRIPNLVDELDDGEYAYIQSRLAPIWTSVTGNGASPGLAKLLDG